MRPYPKKHKQKKRSGGLAQVVEHLSSKCKTPNSNTSTERDRERAGRKGQRKGGRGGGGGERGRRRRKEEEEETQMCPEDGHRQARERILGRNQL
jgi:hypothetical protein